MNWPDVFLFCFAVGALWSFASLLLGGFHFGHAGHAPVAHAHGHAHAVNPHTLQAHAPVRAKLAGMINPSCAAVFLAWFGGIGYLLLRHSGLAFWIDLVLAMAVGLTGAWLLAAFLRFLQAREQPLNPADYDMVGVLGRVSSAIRPDGVGEVIYVRDSARKLVVARSDLGQQIGRGEEVIVTRYERGIAFVRTWDAMTQGRSVSGPNSLQKEAKHVE